MKDKSRGNGADISIIQQRGLTIGQLSQSVSEVTGLRCTPAMIYNYELHGIISPFKRTEGGFRQFSIEDIQLVSCIKRWQSQGLTLAMIKEQLEKCPEDFGIVDKLPDLPVDRRLQILEAARLVFPRKGYAFTTLNDVAQEIGISSSTIYQYFRSKEDLFLALIDNLSFMDILDQMNETLTEIDGDDYKAMHKALSDVANGFLDTHSRNAEIVRMFIAESRSFPEVGKRYCQRLIEPVEKMLERFIKYQIQRGVFRSVDPKLAVHAFYGIFLNFIVTQQLLQGEDVLYFPKKDRVSKLVDIYLSGMIKGTDK